MQKREHLEMHVSVSQVFIARHRANFLLKAPGPFIQHNFSVNNTLNKGVKNIVNF